MLSARWSQLTDHGIRVTLKAERNGQSAVEVVCDARRAHVLSGRARPQTQSHSHSLSHSHVMLTLTLFCYALHMRSTTSTSTHTVIYITDFYNSGTKHIHVYTFILIIYFIFNISLAYFNLLIFNIKYNKNRVCFN